MIATAFAALALSGPAAAESVDYFDVSGVTAAAIFDDINRRGPRAGSGVHALAATEAEYRHESKLAYARGGPCRASDITVSLSLTYRIPRWTDEAEASPAVRAWWAALIADIWAHEKGHAAIAVDGAAAIRAALEETPPAQNCDDVSADMRRRMRRVLAETIEPAQARFDLRNRAVVRLNVR